ncbi:MAG: ribonuclease Z [Candidatus Heimdallarchaeota archaeon]
MSSIKIVFLGTSAAVPTKERFLSSLSLQRDSGEILLFDCGEGTQFRLMKFGVNFQKISKIFISHLHSDHIYGLFGLLSTMKFTDRTKPLNIYGPFGIKSIIEAIKGDLLNYPYEIHIHEIDEGLVLEEEKYRVFAQSVPHGILTLAYAYIEKDRLGRFNSNKAKSLKVKKGAKWQKLQNGVSVLSDDNKVIMPEMVLGTKRRGFKIVIASDGLYNEEFVPFARDADILVMESTYTEKFKKNALEKLHSTAKISAKIAAQANAKKLILTHISARFKEDTELVAEAQKEFPNAIIAYDGLEINMNLKDLNDEEQ